MNILEELAQSARRRVAEKEKQLSLVEIRSNALSLPMSQFVFETSIQGPGLSFICDIMSAGTEASAYKETALAYEKAGADGISILVEPDSRPLQPDYLKNVSKAVSIPCLFKDFIVDEYQIFEARLLGASAVRLISSILTPGQLANAIAMCDYLGISAMVEVHDQEELEKALNAEARIIATSDVALTPLVPEGVFFVFEGTIRTLQDALKISALGANAVLTGGVSAEKTELIIQSLSLQESGSEAKDRHRMETKDSAASSSST